MYERREHKLISRREFARRLFRNFVIGTAITALSLVFGMWGYSFFEGFAPVDAFANAAMILSGMGPLSPLQTSGGKIFAGCYAIYSGLALVASVSVIIAPILHRFLHHFHMEED